VSPRGWDDPAFEPAPPQVDPDADFERMRQRVDDGLECPCCHRTNINNGVALGLPLFMCAWCSTEWFDSVTRPTCE